VQEIGGHVMTFSAVSEPLADNGPKISVYDDTGRYAFENAIKIIK